MKKIFLLAAVAVAAMFTSCSKENTNKDGLNEPGGLTTPTYATFSFKINSTSTRAVETDENEPVEDNNGTQKINSVHFLIFNETTGVCEVNEKITSTKQATYLISAGTKKIYALANLTSTMEGKVTAYTVGSDTKFHPTFLEEFFDATEANKPVFSLVGLYNTSEAFPMSNTNGTTYTLKPNISKTDAETGLTGASITGVSTTNSFSLQIGYMLSKVLLGVKSGITTADFSSAKFAVRNIARKTSLVQRISGGNEFSWYYGRDVAGSYDTDFDRSSTPSVIVPATGFSAKAIYVAENNNSNITSGQASYVALNCEYKPQVVVNPVEWPLTKTGNPSGATYYMLTEEYKSGGRSIPAGTYFQSVTDIATAIKFMITPLDPTSVTTTQWNAVVPLIEMADGSFKNVVRIAIYSGAQSYYRINLGDGTGTATKYGVLRGNVYKVTVNAITGPGYPNITGLDNGWRDDHGVDENGDDKGPVDEDPTVKPEDPIDAQTAVAVTISAKTWNAVNQGADL